MEVEAAERPPNIAIISGEVSGDVVAGALAASLNKLLPGLRIWGVGSSRMKDAGVELLHNSGQWSAIGVVEALKLYPELRFRMYPSLLREISARKPRAVVLIDFGAFNFKVARWCKSRGFRVFYYFPPGSWKRNRTPNPEIARVTDCIATPFPWSEDMLKAVGANAHFVGHPLLEIAKPSMTRADFANRFNMEAGQPIVGLLPGSRPFEIEHNIPVMIEAAAKIRADIPAAQFVFGAANKIARRLIENSLRSLAHARPGISQVTREMAETVASLDRERRRQASPRMVTTEGIIVSLGDFEDGKKRPAGADKADNLRNVPIVIAEDLTFDVMAHSDAIIVCSGTATLEAAILGTPMVIIYRGSRLMEFEYKLRQIKVDHIGLPNIIAGERIVPEFLQHDASPAAIADSIGAFLRDPANRAETKRRLQGVTRLLGTAGASDRTAALVLKTAGLEP